MALLSMLLASGSASRGVWAIQTGDSEEKKGLTEEGAGGRRRHQSGCLCPVLSPSYRITQRLLAMRAPLLPDRAHSRCARQPSLCLSVSFYSRRTKDRKNLSLCDFFIKPEHEATGHRRPCRARENARTSHRATHTGKGKGKRGSKKRKKKCFLLGTKCLRRMAVDQQ